MEDEVAVDEDGHELLAADRSDRAAVGRVDVDPLHLDALVGERQRHALHVRRERDPVDAERVGRHAGTLPTAFLYSAYSGQFGAAGSNRAEKSRSIARSASMRPLPKHVS